jgi:hypothetical protein
MLIEQFMPKKRGVALAFLGGSFALAALATLSVNHYGEWQLKLTLFSVAISFFWLSVIEAELKSPQKTTPSPQ